MLKFFVDDSGSHPQQDGLFVLYGYSMEEPRWEDFAERWDAVLKRPDFFPIDYCRMSDAEGREGPFKDMDQPFRYRKVLELAEVIDQCRPTPVGCKMEWNLYHNIVKGKVDPRLDNPYAILFFQIMRGVTELQIKLTSAVPDEEKIRLKEKYGVEIAIKPVDFIFDDQGPAGMQCLQWWGALKEKLQPPHSIVIGNTPQFKNDREVNPLQAADMLAWHIRRDFEYPNEDRSKIFNLLNPEGCWENEITANMLHQIVDIFNNRVDLTAL